MEWVPLKRIARLAYGSSLPADNRAAGDIPVVGSGGVGGFHNESNVCSPGIIVGRKGSYGSVRWVSSESFAIDTAYYLDRRNVRSDMRWLYYVLQSVDLKGVSQDVGVPGLSREAAHEVKIPFLADLCGQQKVAEFLDLELAKMDTFTDRLKRFFALVRERENGLIEKFLNPRGVDGSDLEGWRQVPLMHLTDPSRQIMYGIVLPGPHVEGGVPIVKGGDVANGRMSVDLLNRTTPEIESGYVRSRLRGGDIVIAIRGSVGEVALVPSSLKGANLTQDAARISPAEGVDVDWLRLVLLSPGVSSQIQSRVTGATIKGINIRDLKRIIIPCPPVEEQRRLAQELLTEIAVHEEIEAKVDRHMALLEERRRALITAAVTGQIDITTARGADLS